MLALIDVIGPIVQTGAVGAMLIIMVRWIKAKDRKSYEMIEAQNAERKEMYQSHSELIQEVTTALVDKNHTDDKMATAVTKLAEELRDIHDALKERHDETS
jgi:predicted transcriptional regulator